MAQGLFKYFGGEAPQESLPQKRPRVVDLSSDLDRPKPPPPINKALQANEREPIEALRGALGGQLDDQQLLHLLRSNKNNVEAALNAFLDHGVSSLPSSSTSSSSSSPLEGQRENNDRNHSLPPETTNQQIHRSEKKKKSGKETWPKLLCSALTYAESITRMDEQEVRRNLSPSATLRVVAQSSACLAQAGRKQVKSSTTDVKSKKKRTKNLKGFPRSNSDSSCIVRISVIHRATGIGEKDEEIFFARLPKDVAIFFHPLLHAGVISVQAKLQEGLIPERLEAFTPVPITVFVSLMDDSVFNLFDEQDTAAILNPTANALFQLIQFAKPKIALLLNPPSTSNDDRRTARMGEAIEEDGGDPCGRDLSQEDVNMMMIEMEKDKGEEVAMEDPPGLTVTLRSHQRKALKWMLHREEYGVDTTDFAGQDEESKGMWREERFQDGTPFYVNIYKKLLRLVAPPSPKPTRCGILADEMGLGKTICVIALLLAQKAKQPPTISSTSSTSLSTTMLREKGPRRFRGGTLVVCPVSLLGQWELEMRSKVENGLINTFVYHGSERSKSHMDLSGFDCVLTSYGVVSSETSSPESVLFATDWDRIVLDEAHIVKNRSTDKARAIAKLSAECRWALTGTPIQNHIDDLFGITMCLKFEPWDSYLWWSKVIRIPFEQDKCPEESAAAMQRVRQLLQLVMLRRTKAQLESNGDFEAMCNLPPKQVEVVEVLLSAKEREFYQSLYNRSKASFDGFVAAGSARSNYAAILAMLCRLRQACDHPFLVISGSAVSEKEPCSGFFESKETERFTESSTSSFGTMENILKAAFQPDSECPICLDAPQEPVVTECKHVFCDRCLPRPSGTFECPVCRFALTRHGIKRVEASCSTPALIGPEGTLIKSKDDLLSKHWRNSSKIDLLLRYIGDFARLNRALAAGERLENLSPDLRAIATGHLVAEELVEMENSVPPLKVLVFSQFTGMLDLIERALGKAGHKYTRLDGSLSQTKRVQRIRTFSESTSVNVFLVSLMAGGVGLNLTAASVAFLVDPWWNPQVEKQAICRVHRMGQTRPVKVHRFICKDTVEEKMLTLQERKAAMASDALQELDPGEMQRQAANNRLSLEDLMDLFR